MVYFKIDTKYGPCEERFKVQFNSRFLEWLAITHAEEQARGGTFDVVAFTENIRLHGLTDFEISELETVRIFLFVVCVLFFVVLTCVVGNTAVKHQAHARIYAGCWEIVGQNYMTKYGKRKR